MIQIAAPAASILVTPAVSAPGGDAAAFGISLSTMLGSPGHPIAGPGKPLPPASVASVSAAPPVCDTEITPAARSGDAGREALASTTAKPVAVVPADPAAAAVIASPRPSLTPERVLGEGAADAVAIPRFAAHAPRSPQAPRIHAAIAPGSPTAPGEAPDDDTSGTSAEPEALPLAPAPVVPDSRPAVPLPEHVDPPMPAKLAPVALPSGDNAITPSHTVPATDASRSSAVAPATGRAAPVPSAAAPALAPAPAIAPPPPAIAQVATTPPAPVPAPDARREGRTGADGTPIPATPIPATSLPQALPPVIAAGAAAPAFRLFAEALHAARRDERASDPLAPSLVGAIDPIRPAPAAAAQGAPLDLTGDRWPQAMIDRIAALRDDAGAAADAASTSIRVLPESLGAIDISIRRDGDTVHVHFAAEQAATRALLTDAQPRLTEFAEARGLKLGQASVGGGPGQQPQRQPTPQPANIPESPAPAARDHDPELPTTRVA